MSEPIPQPLISLAYIVWTPGLTFSKLPLSCQGNKSKLYSKSPKLDVVASIVWLPENACEVTSATTIGT